MLNCECKWENKCARVFPHEITFRAALCNEWRQYDDKSSLPRGANLTSGEMEAKQADEMFLLPNYVL